MLALRAAAQEKYLLPTRKFSRKATPATAFTWSRKAWCRFRGWSGQDVRHVFSRVGPGEIFGEMAVLENKPRSASAVADGATHGLFYSARRHVEAGRKFAAAFARVCLREISHRLREFNRQYIQEVLQTERLAFVGRFARSIVHDLKNPLNIISITAEMAGDGKEHAGIARRLARSASANRWSASANWSMKSWNSRRARRTPSSRRRRITTCLSAI